mmetsp:Transcript_117921/g.338164  ORF Transcript_117921/g.338164 Transcript_117921/m.338164 type:complete len:212 (+) Transcript_117921:728-1363(+)
MTLAPAAGTSSCRTATFLSGTCPKALTRTILKGPSRSMAPSFRRSCTRTRRRMAQTQESVMALSSSPPLPLLPAPSKPWTDTKVGTSRLRSMIRSLEARAATSGSTTGHGTPGAARAPAGSGNRASAAARSPSVQSHRQATTCMSKTCPQASLKTRCTRPFRRLAASSSAAYSDGTTRPDVPPWFGWRRPSWPPALERSCQALCMNAASSH